MRQKCSSEGAVEAENGIRRVAHAMLQVSFSALLEMTISTFQSCGFRVGNMGFSMGVLPMGLLVVTWYEYSYGSFGGMGVGV